MASCLGVVTENKLIKYAKVSKEHDDIKVDAYGIMEYEDLEKAIEQIVEETDSKNIPINTNLTEEMYNKFNLFSGLSKKDVSSMLDSEFELLCEDKGYTYNALESKYVASKDFLNKDVLNVIYVSASKGDIVGKFQKMSNYRVESAVPVPIALLNLVNTTTEKNFAVVNISEKTVLTIVSNGEIYSVEMINSGMKEILDKINVEKNSYMKSYEACKMTTIYTSKTMDISSEETGYLDDIVPVLFNIITSIKSKLDETTVSINKIFITGTVSAINNVDYYFQDYFQTIKCELLTPEFIDRNSNINVKDYVEVNSALALALQGLGMGRQEVNFKNIYVKTSPVQTIKNLMTTKIDKDAFAALKNIDFKVSFSGPLTHIEGWITRLGVTCLLFLIAYTLITSFLSNSISEKQAKAENTIKETEEIIAMIDNNTMKANNKTSEYSARIVKLENINDEIKTKNKYRKVIPNLLINIMSVIPSGVQITSIENTMDDRIVISAQAAKYEQLAYFKVKLKSEGILTNLNSDSGIKQGTVVKITIEGNLP